MIMNHEGPMFFPPSCCTYSVLDQKTLILFRVPFTPHTSSSKQPTWGDPPACWVGWEPVILRND